jgi:acyl-CoA synthetase (AMP-forming)/AMP-acid ligase II
VTESANIARHLPLMATRQPDHPAVKIPRGRTGGQINYLTLNFRELDAEVDAWVAHLESKGVRTGDRVLVMVRQGLPLIAAAFALFKLGAVPVIIDPGMGLKSFLACVARSRPRVLLGIPLAQILSLIFRSAFAAVEIRIWASSSATARIARSKIEHQKSKIVASAANDLAAVLFTSGSTGSPKGVCYEHGMFDAQVRLVRDTYGITPGEVDLPMLPIFALFNPALGMTTIVPEINPSRPASVDPAKIVQAILQENVTTTFGSPTLWRKIFDHCLKHRIQLPSLRRVLCAGAAVPASLWADAPRVLPNGRLHSPYGATEVLPVASVAADEIVPASSAGSLIGRPLPDNRVKIIAVQDGPIASLDHARELPRGEIGEIIVTGPTVTKAYDALPDATAAAKIVHTKPTPGLDGSDVLENEIWHRMGDAGYFDPQGRLWFCGRLVERITTAIDTLYTEPCEQVFRSNPHVARCALIGLGPLGQQEPALVVQLLKSSSSVDKATLAGALRHLALRHPHTAGIKRFFFHSSFPVDVRHNAKIHRLTLARWAAGQKGHETA